MIRPSSPLLRCQRRHRFVGHPDFAHALDRVHKNWGLLSFRRSLCQPPVTHDVGEPTAWKQPQRKFAPARAYLNINIIRTYICMYMYMTTLCTIKSLKRELLGLHPESHEGRGAGQRQQLRERPGSVSPSLLVWPCQLSDSTPPTRWAHR